MVDAIDKKEFDAVLTAETKEVAADSSVQDKYKTMSTYTTTTTSNSNRNENIRSGGRSVKRNDCQTRTGIFL